MIVLDATILAYAVGGPHGLRAPCRDLVEAIRDGRVAATTTVEVIQELVHIRARRFDVREAAARGSDFCRLLRPLLFVGEAELVLGLRLYQETDGLGALDAVLAATAMLSGAEALVSADRAFARVSGLQHLDPEGPEVRRLTRA